MSGSGTDRSDGLPSWAVAGPRRVAHIARVAALLDAWAAARGVSAAEADRWRRAALFHDALRDAPKDVLATYTALSPEWPRGVWHGPAAAALAARHGERDAGVLDAVRYHSLGWAGWDDVGRFLFLADALEPGRTHERALLDALAERAPREPAAVLREVASLKLQWLVRSGRLIPRETWDFWNSLAADDSSSSR